MSLKSITSLLLFLVTTVPTWGNVQNLESDQAAIRKFMESDQSASLASQRTSMSEFARHIRIHGSAGLDVQIIEFLQSSALRSTDEDMRALSYEVLANLRSTHALAQLSEGLKDESDRCVHNCLQGFGKLEADAKSAVPLVLEKLNEKKFESSAISALGNILERDAIPIVLDAYQKLTPEGQWSARMMLANHPDARSLELMTREFHDSPEVIEALYFTGLDVPESVEQLRWVVKEFGICADDPSKNQRSDRKISEVRGVALRYLSDKQDRETLKILVQAIDQANVRVKVSAAEALANYNDSLATQALARMLAEDDAYKHDMTLGTSLASHAIRSLAKIDTDESLGVLFDAVSAQPDGSGQKASPDRVWKFPLIDFWRFKATEAQIDFFLKRFEANPSEGNSYASIVSMSLGRFPEKYKADQAEAEKLKRLFFEQVIEDDVTPTTAPSKYPGTELRPVLKIRGTFAIYSVTMQSPKPGSFGSGYSYVYHFRNGAWHRVGKCNEWVS